MSGHGGRHLKRIRAATDFEGTFDEIAVLVTEAGAEEALRLALLWCSSDEPSARAAGLDVLSALVQEDDGILELCVAQAAAVAADDEDEDLRWSAAHLLGSLPHLPFALREQALQVVLRFEDDPDGDVRWQVVFALACLSGQEPLPEHPGVQALLRRLDDEDAGVRDWAAFGLGLTRVDTPRVRQELHRLVAKPHEKAAGEAAVALAQLGDRSVLPRLLRQLADPTVGNLWVEAAASLGASEALPLLEHLHAAGWAEDKDEPRPYLLAQALVKCRTTEAGRRVTSGLRRWKW